MDWPVDLQKTPSRFFTFSNPSTERRVLVVQLQYGQEGLLRDVHGSNLSHALLSFFLLFQQLALPADVSPIAFSSNVLAHGRYGFPGHDLLSDSRLYGNHELLPRQQLLKLSTELSPKILHSAAVDQRAESIYFLSVQQDIHFDDIADPIINGLIIKGG